MRKERSISATFAAIILVVAIIVASIAAVETVRLNTNSTATSHGYTSTSSSFSSSSMSTTSSLTSSQSTSSSSSTSQPLIVLVYGNATIGDYTGECGGGFYPTGVTFTSSKGVNYSSDVTNLSSYPSNQTGPGPRLEGYTTGSYSVNLPNNNQYNVTIQQKNDCVPNEAPTFCNAGTLNLDANAAKEEANVESINIGCVSSSSSTSSYGYVIMFQESINSSYAWGLNETSSGGYNGGFAFNPSCFSCVAYNASNPNSIKFGYEYPWYDYATYHAQPLGVYYSQPYVNIISFQYTVAYPGVGNRVYIKPNDSMTLEVISYQVPMTIQNQNGIYTSVPPNAVPYAHSYITIYPNSTSCGGFIVPFSSNVTCS